MNLMKIIGRFNFFDDHINEVIDLNRQTKDFLKFLIPTQIRKRLLLNEMNFARL